MASYASSAEYYKSQEWRDRVAANDKLQQATAEYTKIADNPLSTPEQINVAGNKATAALKAYSQLIPVIATAASDAFTQSIPAFTNNPFKTFAEGLLANKPIGTGGVGGNQVSILVGIDNTIDLTGQAFDSLANQVGNSITDAVRLAQDAQKSSTDAILNSVGGLTNNIFQGVKDALGNIGDWIASGVKSIFENIGPILRDVFSNIGSLLKQIGETVREVLGPIAETVQKIASTIQDINDKFIQPITNLVVKTLDTIESLTKAIEGDLHAGLKGILQIPKDIADGIGSLDATMQRTLDQLGRANKDTINVELRGVLDKTIGERLASIDVMLSKRSGANASDTTFSDHVNLGISTAPRTMSKEVVAEAWKAVYDSLALILDSGKEVLNDVKKGLSIPTLLGDLVEIVVSGAILVYVLQAQLHPIMDDINEAAEARSRRGELSPGDALTAWVRQFINEKDLDAELAIHGWNDARLKVIKDLQRQMIATTDAFDMYYRGIISEADLRENLTHHAYGKEEIDALMTASFRLSSVEGAAMSWRYNLITDEALITVLQANRYTKGQIERFFGTVLHKESASQLIERHKRETLYSNHLTQDSIFKDVPADIVEAAKRDGFDAQTAFDMWQAQFNIPPIGHWLELYFRGIRTKTELWAAFDYYRVPQEWREDYIDVRRNLLPFRTIPRMLESGVIDHAYAKSQLQAHGYDLKASDAILKFAQATSKKVEVKASGNLHSLSVGNAKQFFDMGAITEEQYREILMSHGYDEDSTNLTIEVEKLAHHAKERKQQAQDLVDEIVAGLITVDQAQERMTQLEFSVTERARVMKQVSRAFKAVSKTPSEAEMRAMVKKDVIDLEDYINGMILIGYSKSWVEAFVKLHFGGDDGNDVSDNANAKA